MRYLFKIILILISKLLISQPMINIIGDDTITICTNGQANLQAQLSSNFNLTTSYSVSQISYSPLSYTGTVAVNSGNSPLFDDQITPIIPIGFTFCFYGNIYTNCYISSNGWLGFSPGQTVAFTSATIPSTSWLVPRNCIMSPWHDLNPGLSNLQSACSTNPTRQYIRYRIEGASPFRRFIVSWINTPMYQCTAICGTQQIVIYESTNIIEHHIERKVTCLAWANGTATQGLHNIDGTQAITVPGRNSTIWTANNESWRFTPTGINLPIIIWQINSVPQGSGYNYTASNLPIGYTKIIVVAMWTCSPYITEDEVIIYVNPCCNPYIVNIYEN